MYSFAHRHANPPPHANTHASCPPDSVMWLDLADGVRGKGVYSFAHRHANPPPHANTHAACPSDSVMWLDLTGVGGKGASKLLMTRGYPRVFPRSGTAVWLDLI